LTKPSIYTVKGKGPFGIGVLSKRNSNETFLVVSKVFPGGSIDQWNKEFPNKQVSSGDTLRAVNGVTGSACKVIEMLAMNPEEEKKILVFHYPGMVLN